MKHSRYHAPTILMMVIFLMFSIWLMFHTFSYDTDTHTIRMVSKVWSDFAAHIPLIRSFSMGANWDRLIHVRPIESPLFPGEPIRYHFGFYAIVGALERMGLPLDLALNLPSALGFFLLLAMIYLLAYSLFKDQRVGVLSIILFLFNSSLSFFVFFKTHPLSLASVNDILTNQRFPSFGPWDGGTITAFWNLNIYTNQRHLGLSYGLALLVCYILLKKHGSVLGKWHGMVTTLSVAAIASVLLFINYPVAAMLTLFLYWFVLVIPVHRPTIILAFLLTSPAFLLLRHMTQPIAPIILQPGYLTPKPLTPLSFLSFWFDNIGIQMILIPLGVLLAPRRVIKLLAVPMIILFILPNVFRFSPDMINNHKFFNFFMIFGDMFTAYALLQFCRLGVRNTWIRRALVTACILLLTFSGIIDFFAVINDYTGGQSDLPRNEVARWIAANTKPDDVVLNSTWLYHPASLAGRAIFSGYPYFTWSYGYNKDTRETILKTIYETDDKEHTCSLLRANHIGLIELNKTPEEYVKPNVSFWEQFTPAFASKDSSISLYTVSDICKN